MDNAHMRLETRIAHVKHYSIKKAKVQQALDSYKDYFENKEFLEILYSLIKISNGGQFSDKPFKGEYTTFSDGTKAKCEKVTTYYTKLKELNIQELSKAIEFSYNNQLRNETGGHPNYRINEEIEMVVRLDDQNIKFTFMEIEQYLYSIINFQRSINRELSALSFFAIREQLPIIREDVNKIQEEIRKNYLANKNIQIEPSDSMGEYKSNLPTYGVISMDFTFEEIPTLYIYQYWSHAFLDLDMKSFEKMSFSTPFNKKVFEIGFTQVMLNPGDFIIEHTPVIENFIKQLIKYKQFKLVREIIAPNHPFFAILGYPVNINDKQMFHIMEQTRIIDVPDFSDNYLDFISKLTWQEKLVWYLKLPLRRFGL